MDPVMSIVVATNNRGKLAEIRAMLEDLPVEVLSMAEALGEAPNIVEDGDTFQANALIKANFVAESVKMVTLADDSGLEVDALGGRPGVRSARFAREGATDAENNAELLQIMQDVDTSDRTASFRCAIALIDPWKPDEPHVVEGRCNGSVAHSPAGTGGFGYDPLFIVSELGRTMAELNDDEKNQVSHRARALAEILPTLERILRQRLNDARSILCPTGPPTSDLAGAD